MSVVSEVSPNTRKLDVGDFFREAIFLTRSMHKIILKTPYKMAMAFGLRVKQNIISTSGDPILKIRPESYII